MKRPTGFTLLELTVAMVVVAILAAAVVSAFATGLQAWQKAQQQADSNQAGSAILEHISGGLRSASLGFRSRSGNFSLRNDNGGPVLTFTCLATDPKQAQVADFVEVKFRFDAAKSILWRSERSLVSGQSGSSAEPVTEEAAAEDITGFTVRGWDGETWQEEWPPAQAASSEPVTGEKTAEAQPTLPLSVEVKVTIAGGDGAAERVLQATVPIEMAHP